MTRRPGKRAFLEAAWTQVNEDDLAFGRTAYAGYNVAMRAWATHCEGYVPLQAQPDGQILALEGPKE